MKPLASNTLLQNRYLIVHLIGKGGMGEVYLAVDQRLGSPVALKRTFFADHETLGNVFEREARTLARLRHNVLPKVSDHFIEGDNQYLIMEHIAGDDLAKRLETQKKPFPLSWIMYWADQLLDALNYLHTNEPPIIHRDIKPQNLKLTEENSIVLLDFGLSKNSPDANSRLATTTGSIIGYTPHYAPMEQIRGTGTNARSDIYSLSSTLYQLLTDIVPQDALTRADALLGEMSDPLKPINEINPEVTPLISQTILKGMEVSRDKRYSSAREMQKILRDACAQAPLSQDVANNSQSQSLENNVFSAPVTSLSGNIEAFDSKDSFGDKADYFATFTPPKIQSQTESQTADKKIGEQTFSESSPSKTPAPLHKKQSSRQPLFIFAGIGTFLLLIVAAAVAFYASNSPKTITNSNSVTMPETTIEVTPAPTVEAITKTDINPNSVEEKSSNTNSIGETVEKPSVKTAESSLDLKPVQPIAVKVNPRPTLLPVGTPKASAKTMPTPKTTPLPRILP